MHLRHLIFILPVFCLAFSRNGELAQSTDAWKPECAFYYHKALKKNVYTKVEIEAEFPGGTVAYMRFLNKNLNYPEEMANDRDWQSSVSATCIIDTDGRIINPEIIHRNGPSEYSPLDKHFIQLIKSMPKWTPAICEGKKVASEAKIVIGCLLPGTSE